jgi:DNA-binding CsgD family transcriptional regulator
VREAGEAEAAPRLGERWPFVAREGAVAAVLRAIGGPEPGGAIVVGPAGVGKTRLVEEVLAGAPRPGYRCLRVHASEAARPITLGAFARLLPVPAPGAGAGAGRNAAGRAAAPGGRLAAALRDMLAQGEEWPGRTVLFVDDIDLLDRASAMVVHQLVADRALDVVATLRIDLDPPEFIAALWRTGRLTRLDLAPLGDEAVADLVAAVLPGPMSSMTMAYVQRVAAGNPRYLRELLTGAHELGSLSVRAGLWHIDQRPAPAPRLADLIRNRLSTTTAAERAALELVATAGGLGLDLLHRLADPAAVESLERRGLLVVRPDGRRRSAQLDHPMYGEVLRATLPGTAWRRHSASLADAFPATGLRRQDDLLRWAQWRLDGGGAVDDVRMSAAAAQATALRAGPALRERLARRAWQGQGDVRSGILLCCALFDLGHFAEAWSTLDDLGQVACSDADRARVALARSFYLGWGAGRVDLALSIVDGAESRIEAAQWRDELAAQRAMLLAASGSPEPALAMGPSLQDTGSIRSLTAAGIASLVVGRFTDAMALTRQAYRLAVESSTLDTDIGEHAGAAGLCLRVLADAGHTGPARDFGAAALRTAAWAGDAHGLAWISAALASLELRAGDLGEAGRHALEAVSYFERAHSPIALAWSLAVGVMVAVHRGETARADELAGRLAATRPQLRQLRLFHDEIDRATAWHAIGRVGPGPVCRKLADRARQWLSRGALTPAVGVCADLARLGDPATAAEILRGCAVPPDWPLGQVIVRFVGASAAADARDLEVASADFSRLGVYTYAADAMAAAASAWRVDAATPGRADHRGGRAEGRGGRAESRGGRASAAAAALAARCGDLRTPLLAGVAQGRRLTGREREIALIAAQGRSNREIADRLTVSERTVENHLAHVYTKLGLAGRGGLAAWFNPAPGPAELSGGSGQT